MDVPAVNIPLLLTCYKRVVDGGCVYQWGIKPSPDADSSEVKASDCSGMTRWLIARATGQALILPEGSADQLAWCENASLHRLQQYSDVQYASQDPGRLFICFIENNPQQPGERHVWLVNEGKTIEAHGSGVNSRSWNADVLLRLATDSFELPATDGVAEVPNS